MTAKLTINYFASHDMLGMASEEEYRRFKAQLLEAFQQEWPDATVTIDDDEEVYVETGGASGQAELDVKVRIADIVNEVLDSCDWQEEEAEFNGEDDAGLRNVEEKDDY